ncbi:MAG TPA: hypothetical protein VF813_06825 [Anaerolineaceae bacterium]
MATITVSDAFELILEAFETHVLCSGTMSSKYGARRDSEIGKEIRELEDITAQFERVYRRWLLFSSREKSGHISKLPTMASMGVRTNEYEYDELIINAMIQVECRGDYDEVIEEVGRTAELTRADRQRTMTYPFNPRWSVAVFNAILKLLNREYLQEDDNGYLVLTEKGKEAYTEMFEENE